MATRAIATIALVCGLVFAAQGAALAITFSFDMIVSPGARTCLPHATAHVEIVPADSGDTTEIMTVTASGLPAHTDFDFFVIQVPNKPFGLAWYNGDVFTNSNGDATQTFRARFQFGTFVIAPGVAAAPQTHTSPPFPDALRNPETIGPSGTITGPVQLYHLGLWFDSATDAEHAGCPDTVTPFNSEHDAGIQVLNTANYLNTQGPLSDINP